MKQKLYFYTVSVDSELPWQPDISSIHKVLKVLEARVEVASIKIPFRPRWVSRLIPIAQEASMLSFTT
jgi:hypothetical protein